MKLRVPLALLFVVALLFHAVPSNLSATDGPCQEDIRKFCRDVTPGSGRIDRCLREHEAEVSRECREMRLGIREKVRGTLDACLPDVNRFCRRVQAGEARIVRCLKEHEAELSLQCRAQAQGLKDLVDKDHSCYQDQEEFCGDVVPGEGRILNCMTEHRPDLSDACNAYIEYTLLQIKVEGVGRELMDACKADLQKHCRGIPPGKGRLKDCLWEHENEISRACRAKVKP
jgi:Golgi apparatus protein 1